MLVSLNWLKDYVDVALGAEELAHGLTMAGLEVSRVERVGEGLGDVVVAQLLERGQHPNADRLSRCRVTDGSETYDIVCGATNMAAGDRVALARVGAVLPGGFKIQKAKIRGQASFGMMCSERELGLSQEHEGILILPPDLPLGQPVAEALGYPDALLEVEITPNRADCLSVVGVAREVAALTGGELRVPRPRVPDAGPAVAAETSVEILAPDLCHRYAARVIRGVTIGPSPAWLRRRLLAAGVRSINNVVDVTNYVLLELGHPLHAFDLNRLAGGRIVVQRATDGEVFTTLDGQERRLGRDTLVICDAERPVAVAGVMGGLNSEVGADTVDLLLESAYFLPEGIRRTSRALGLRTEASYRFERGTDVEGLIRALDRAAELIASLAGGTVAAGIWDAYPTPHPKRRVGLRTAAIHRVLGVEVGADEAGARLTALGMTVRARDGEALEVEIPTHRVDVEREIDLIEEVARLGGYDAIPATLPGAAVGSSPLPAAVVRGDAARDALVSSGLYEAVTLSFGDPRDDQRLGGGAADAPKVVVQNPLSRELGILRTSLLPGLLRVAGLNVRRQAGDVRLFEVGRTFHPVAGQPLPREVQRAAAVLVGSRAPLGPWAKAEPVDFFDAKGVLVDALARLGVRDVAFEPTADLPWLHPGRGARVRAGNRDLGWLGQVRGERAEAFELELPAVAFELDLEAVGAGATGPAPWRALPRYPAVERDLALVVERAVPVQAVLDAVAAVGSPLVRSVVLFDAFEGGRIPAGQVSLAFRVTLRSDERTLTEGDIAQVESDLLACIGERTGARLRDS